MNEEMLFRGKKFNNGEWVEGVCCSISFRKNRNSQEMYKATRCSSDM